MDTRCDHVLVELFGCDSARLDDEAIVHAALRHAAEAAAAQVLQVVTHRYAPQGVSGVAVVAESHLSIHTWPEAGYAAVDLFTCGGCTPGAAVEVVADALGADRSEVMWLERGRLGERSIRPASHVTKQR